MRKMQGYNDQRTAVIKTIDTPVKRCDACQTEIDCFDLVLEVHTMRAVCEECRCTHPECNGKKLTYASGASAKWFCINTPPCS